MSFNGRKAGYNDDDKKAAADSVENQQMVCGDGEEEEGKMPAVKSEGKSKYPRKNEKKKKKSAKSSSQSGQMIAGDAVKTTPVIDVDDVGPKEEEQECGEAVWERKSPATSTDAEIKGEIAGYRTETGMSGIEQEFADHVSEISYDEVDSIDDVKMPSSGRGNGKGDVPPSRLPDLDDTAGPKDHLNQPPGSRASRRTRQSAAIAGDPPTPEDLPPTSASAASSSAAGTTGLDSQVSDWMSTIPGPVPLRSTPATGRRQMSPGAYSVTPPPRRIGTSANTDGDDSTVGTVQILSALESGRNNATSTAHQREQEHDGSPSLPPLQQHQEQQHDTDMLVEATLVEDGDAVDPSMLGGMEYHAAEINGSNGRRHSSVDEEAPTNRELSNDSVALVEAKPLEDHERTFGEAIRSKWTQVNILVVISLITIAIVLGVMAIQRDETSIPTDDAGDEMVFVPTEAPTEQQPTGQPSGLPTWAPTYSIIDDTDDDALDPEPPKIETPIPGTQVIGIAGTMQPSSMPTAAPITRDSLTGALPDYTRESLKATGSPQAEAFEWLWADPSVMDYSLDRMIQRFALKTVLNSVGASNQSILRSGNLYGMHECDWNPLGLRCDSERVLTGIHLGRVGLGGRLPMEIGLLTSLRKIDMSQNQLTNQIPTTIGLVTGLQVMNFGLNALTGSLPYSFTKMKQMRELILNDNSLTGSLPAELGWLIHLRQLRMSYNAFTGSIPGTLRHLTSLETLILNNNRLQGTLPEGLSDLEAAREIELQGNAFSGTIPEHFGDLSNVLVLNLSENDLMGTVPQALENLYSIKRLELQMNSFQGTLPLGVCALKEFRDLSTIKVDCSELECNCLCVCFTDQPIPFDRSQP